MSFSNIFSRRRAAAGAAAVALGGALAACGSSAPTATTTTTGAAATPAAATAKQGMPPGLGKEVTGTAAAKAKAAALASYPGTAERVVGLPDGSYEVHVLRKSGGEVHVRVSKSFTVTGIEQGRGPGGGPGFGKAVTGTAAAKAKAAALASYPGTAERVVGLPDGSYEVHVLRRSGGEVHVRVSKDFKVTGTENGPPAGAPAPPSGSGTASQS